MISWPTEVVDSACATLFCNGEVQLNAFGKAPRGLDGRLISVPRNLSAGCGFAWREPEAGERRGRDLSAQEGVEIERIGFMDL